MHVKLKYIFCLEIKLFNASTGNYSHFALWVNCMLDWSIFITLLSNQNESIQTKHVYLIVVFKNKKYLDIQQNYYTILLTKIMIFHCDDHNDLSLIDFE